MRWYTYDLETTFLKKGFSRPQTQIIELALYSKKDSYQTLVNPLPRWATGEEVIQSLDDLNQHPEKSINFWAKLLIGKNLLNTAVKRKSWEDKAEHISTFLKEHDVPKPLTALTQAFKDRGDAMFVAHNGNAFDSKIIQGNCENLSIQDIIKNVQFKDSLPLLRKELDLASYSQPIVYHHLFKDKYKAHHALDDSKALFKILTKLYDNPVDKFKEKKSSNTRKPSKANDFPKGIGPKSAEFLSKKGIQNNADLNKYIDSHTKEQWLKEMSGVHSYKKLADLLF
jgi:hypothetical protein